jgi:hypothetical protein
MPAWTEKAFLGPTGVAPPSAPGVAPPSAPPAIPPQGSPPPAVPVDESMFSLTLSSLPPACYDDGPSLGPPTTFVDVSSYDPKQVPGPPRMPVISNPPPIPGIGVIDRELDRPGWSIPLTLARTSLRCRVSRRPTAPVRELPGIDLRLLRPSVKPTHRPDAEPK